MVTAAAKKTPAKGRKTPGKKPAPPQVHPDFILSRSIYHELAAAAQELESEINQVEDQIKFIKGDYREDPKKFEMATRVAWSALDSRAKFVLMHIRDAIEMVLDAVIEIDADYEKPDSFTDNFRDFYKKLEGTISIQEKALDGKTLKGVLKDLEKAADLIPSEIGKPSSQGKLRDSIDVMMDIWKTLTGKAPKAPNFETAVPRHNPDQLTMFASSRVARIVAKYAAQFATFTKLRDGSWGLRVPGKASAGQTVQTLTKGGQQASKTVGKVLWSGTDPGGSVISLCTIAESAGAGSSSGGGAPKSRGGKRECDECGEYVVPGTICWETGMRH